MANRGLLQAAGSWSVDACCAVHGNDCHRDNTDYRGPYCTDHTSSSDWLFGLWPGPPQRFEPTGTDTYYQTPGADIWPSWGINGLNIGTFYGNPSGVPGGSHGRCHSTPRERRCRRS